MLTLAGRGLIEREPRTHRYRLTPLGLRLAAATTRLIDRVLDPAIARSGSPPPSAGTVWKRFDAAHDALLEHTNIAA